MAFFKKSICRRWASTGCCPGVNSTAGIELILNSCKLQLKSQTRVWQMLLIYNLFPSVLLTSAASYDGWTSPSFPTVTRDYYRYSELLFSYRLLWITLLSEQSWLFMLQGETACDQGRTVLSVLLFAVEFMFHCLWAVFFTDDVVGCFILPFFFICADLKIFLECDDVK